MISTLKKIMPAIAFTLAIVACEPVPFDPDIKTLNKELLVVYGVIGDHPDFRTIELSRTAPYMDGSEVKRIENARVTVSGPEQSYTFEHTDSGYYKAPTEFQPGIDTTYQLSIELEGEIYESESTMPPPVHMHSLNVQPDRWEDSDAGIYEITAWVKDNEIEDERFVFKYAINEELYDSVHIWSHYTDQLTNNQWLEDAMIFGNIEAEAGDSIDVYVFSISKDYYDFIQASEKNRISHNPLTPPAGVPVTGNISNNALGIFQVSAIVHEKITVQEEKAD